MKSIFDKLDDILNPVNEAEEPKTVKPIPISPDMETADQGLKMAREKLAKFFYRLTMSGGGPDGPSMTDEMDLPDDFLSPELKGEMKGKMEDKEFKKNKALWDPDPEMDKLKKEVDVSMKGDSDDDFDDFDYQDNEFGDDDADTSGLDTEDMDSSGGGTGEDDTRSEDEKLKDAIDDAIDKIKDEKKSGKSSGGDSGQQSSGEESGEESGESKGQSGSSSGDDSGDQQSGEGGDQEGGTPGGQTSSAGKATPGKPQSAKDKRLEDLKKALENGDTSAFDDATEQLKEGEGGDGQLAGEQKTDVSDKDVKSDMASAGLSEEDIQKIIDAKNDDSSESMSEEELDKLKREVVDGLEKKCEKRGGSALAKTVVKNALKAKIDNDEWKEMLKLFLKSKSLVKGGTSKAKNKTVYGHKNHLWRGAVLPTRTWGEGEIQKIYCFIDFSGSVNQDLVYTFLGRVIDLCQELSYTDVMVYGFGDHIVLPRKINGKMLRSQGKDVVLSQTWDYINSQEPGPGSENFEDVAHTINEIRRKDKESVFLIFGDALWSKYGNAHPPMYLKNVCGAKVLDSICALTYYQGYYDDYYAGEIAYLKELVGLKHVITTKASSIRE